MRHQSGTTLISLLIGLLISMLCLIGLLSSYRTMVKTGVESRIAATHDTELQNGLTASQMLIQNAGFGLDGTGNLEVATISIDSNSTSALLWRYEDNNNTICQGLADVPSSTGKRKFVTINSNASCDSTVTLSTLEWTINSTLANLADYSADQSNPQQVTFAKAFSNCSPFGATVSDSVGSHPLVTISAKTSTQNIAGLDAIKASVCILNITA